MGERRRFCFEFVGAKFLTIFKGGAFGLFARGPDVAQFNALSPGDRCTSKSPPFKNGRLGHTNLKIFGNARAARHRCMQFGGGYSHRSNQQVTTPFKGHCECLNARIGSRQIAFPWETLKCL